MKSRILRLSLLAAAVLLPLGALAHIRLVHPTNGNPLFWASPTNIGIVINSDGSDDISDGSHETTLRLAIEEWNAVSGTNAQLVEDTSPASQARTDWQSFDIHLIVFDENNSSGFFPDGSSTVALTPIFFQNNGNIVDADVIYNGGGWMFTTEGPLAQHFDVGDVGTHELGHLLGLNHSAYVGSSMYPYVDPSVTLHRSVSADEVKGLRQAYPGGAFGTISGSVRRLSDNSVVRGAYAVATEVTTGRTAATILTDVFGNFSLPGLDPGQYTVSVLPLGSPSSFGDAPVDSGNLGSGYTIDTDFEPGVYGGTATITSVETIPMGTLMVDGDVSLNLGTSSDNFPIRIISGQSQTVILQGTGLFAPATLSDSAPDVHISNPVYFGSQVNFQVTVDTDAPRGHVDLTLINSSGQLTILPGALEVTPPTPSVTSVVPSSGPRSGGSALTISGTNFESGAKIVIGDQIYADGINGTSVVNATTITLTTQATLEGTHDVVVFDPCGIDGRLANGFTSQNQPGIANVFPVAGEFSGGTTVTITGQDFQSGIAVRIDGVDQGSVTFVDSTQISFTTVGGATGGPYLMELENPDLGLATSAFSYAADPDPQVTLVDPGSGTIAGGDTITINGANFGSGLTVLFGADPSTGLGGTAAPMVTTMDASTLEVQTPSHGSGTVSVIVRDDASGQVGMLAASFAFVGGESGGGCTMVPVSGPQDPGELLAATWWLLALLATLSVRKMRSRALLGAS